VRISGSVADAIILIVFMLVYEFLLVLTDPWIEALTGGAPAYKLAFNVGVVVIFYPIHKFFGGRLKKQIVRTTRRKRGNKGNITKIIPVLLIIITHSFYSYSPTPAEVSTSSVSNTDATASKNAHQTSIIDPLENLLKTTKEDTNKFLLIMRISEKIAHKDPGKSLEYAFQALGIAKKLDYRKGIAQSSHDIGLIYMHKGDFEKATDFYLQSLKIMKQIQLLMVQTLTYLVVILIKVI